MRGVHCAVLPSAEKRRACVEASTRPATTGSLADERTRHLTRMVAVAGTRRDDLVFAGVSAAAVWGLPLVGAWPPTVEALAGPRSGVTFPQRRDVAPLGGSRR